MGQAFWGGTGTHVVAVVDGAIPRAAHATAGGYCLHGAGARERVEVSDTILDLCPARLVWGDVAKDPCPCVRA